MKMRLHFCHHAAAGYLCSVETTSELDKDDLEGILNILTVGELREMLSVINKVCHCTRLPSNKFFIA